MPGSASSTRTSRAARFSEAGAAVFQLMQVLDRSAEIWGGSEVSRGRLAVLRVLATEGPMTMSDIARARHISRQGVQRLAGALVEEGWVVAEPNPRHRRAPLMGLTASGLAAYRDLAQAEAERLNELARGLKADDIRAASKVIDTLRIRGAATPQPDVRGKR